MAVSLAIVVGIAFLAITYGAVVQVLPAGQAVSEEYAIEYGTVTDDPDGNGRDYDYNVGPPLVLRYELSDNVISEDSETRLTVEIHNPSDNHLRGALEVRGRTNYHLKGELATLNFDLSPGESVVATITLSGEKLVADRGPNPRTVTFDAEASIFNDPYMAISTNEVEPRGEKTELKVRKPFFSRLGFYWLGFLALAGSLIGYVIWREHGGTPGLA